MINPNHIKKLPLGQLRRELLECQVCFNAPNSCAHHEDVVGGYHEGRVVVVGLNPQAPPNHPVYTAIQSAPWSAKRDLSDRIYEIFLGQTAPNTIHSAWVWTLADHPGIRPGGWLSMLCTQLALSEQELVDHVLLVETFKHATADKGALRSNPRWKVVSANCPTWVREQLDRLAPRLIVLCGDDARLHVAPHLLASAAAQRVAATPITGLHGKTFMSIGPHPKCIMFTIGVSKSSRGWWAQDRQGTDRVRQLIRVAIAGHDPCSPENVEASRVRPVI